MSFTGRCETGSVASAPSAATKSTFAISKMVHSRKALLGSYVPADGKGARGPHFQPLGEILG
eukprot:298283-Prorocentrum_lima.AAC.1